jgi:two-component system, LuxR family, response regulator FixJ
MTPITPPTEATNATVFIVDDDPAVCRSVAAILGAHGLASRIFPSADRFLGEFDAAAPGCVLLDLRMPGITGEELLRTLRQGGVNIPVIIITGHGDVPTAVRAMKLGLVDFLQKPVDHSILIETVRLALRQDELRRAAERVKNDAVARIERLTPRERELMGLLAAGQTSKEIAAALSVSVKTVDNHRAHLLSKLQASNVAELAAIAVRAGLAT